MPVKIYSDCLYQRYLCRQLNKQYFPDVAVEAVPNGIIANEHANGYGVFTSDGEFVKSSFQMHRHGTQKVPQIDMDNIPYVDKDVIFIGNAKNHFGHFILEHLNRAWALCGTQYHNMHIVLIDNLSLDSVPGYIYKFLELMGVGCERVFILKQTTRFRNVFVPGQAYNMHTFVSDKYIDAFKFMAKNVPDADVVYDRVYLSRDALSVGRTYGEKYVQSIFEQNGFHVVYPEKLSLENQIALMKNCRVLAGCAGTALHMALFMPRGGTVIQIKRNKKKRDSATSQYLINKCAGLKSVFVSGCIEKMRSAHSSNMPQVIGLNKHLRRFFNDNGYAYDKNLPVIDNVAWDEYNTELQKYRDEFGSVFLNWLKRKFVRISSCMVIGRENRARYRRWMRKTLGCK